MATLTTQRSERPACVNCEATGYVFWMEGSDDHLCFDCLGAHLIDEAVFFGTAGSVDDADSEDDGSNDDIEWKEDMCIVQ